MPLDDNGLDDETLLDDSRLDELTSPLLVVLAGHNRCRQAFQ